MAISHLYGLIGKSLSHSFSKLYFTDKFAREDREGYAYELFELPSIHALPALLAAHPELRGLNVTVPYKEEVLPYLDGLSPLAREVGAVNCIYVTSGRKLIGYNTDVKGFAQALKRWYAHLERPLPHRALVLGTGGASKSVRAAFYAMDIQYLVVSRHTSEDQIAYDALDYAIAQADLIVNATPLGMYPQVDTCPPLPFERLTPAQAVFDLIYNPVETELMRRAAAQGCPVVNGLDMLQGQADEAWRIWQEREPTNYFTTKPTPRGPITQP